MRFVCIVENFHESEKEFMPVNDAKQETHFVITTFSTFKVHWTYGKPFRDTKCKEALPLI